MLGDALAGFDAALHRFRAALASDRMLTDAVFDGSQDWVNLLRYKLVPHLAGDGCLIAAVAGGTNTGKSTVFNMLLGRSVSPVRATAAATTRPLLAANDTRAAQCLEAKLVPEFKPFPLKRAEAVIEEHDAPEALFVTVDNALPDRLVLLDTPDVDSIARQHWAVADNIRAAGDVLIAVLTPEKYKDDRVVTFFRQARASGRVVIPLMNKANPASDFAVARQQLEEFRADVDTDAPAFVVPHDFALQEHPEQPIASIDGRTTLRAYLDQLDVHDIKERVYRGTVAHFVESAAAFVDAAAGVGHGLDAVSREMEARAIDFARQYDPTPGPAVGGLFHEFVQRKRGPVRRFIGAASGSVAKGIGAVARRLSSAFRRRSTLEATDTEITEEELRAAHARVVEGIARDLATSHMESTERLREPSAHLLAAGLERLDVDAAAAAVVRQTLRSQNVSQEFREHAYRLMEKWWEDHSGKRRALEALDTLLAITPAAIAAPLSLITGGVGVSEAVVVAGPIVEQFVARVIEYQFGDAMFDFLSPWKKEQQEALRQALLQHITSVCTERLRHYVNVLNGEPMVELREWLAKCRTA